MLNYTKRLLTNEINQFLGVQKISDKKKIIEHLEQAKSLIPIKPLDSSIVDHVLEEATLNFQGRILLRELETETETVLRNIVVKFFDEKESWKKLDLKKRIHQLLADHNADADVPEK